MKLLLILCGILVTGMNFAAVDHWETAVYENDTWKYLLPNSAVAPSWNTISFNDASWSSGQGGFGYGDGDDNTTFSSTISCYQRIEFNITDINAIDAALLTIDYDDAFVAYLNGVEIARDNITSAGQPPYNQTSDGLHEAQLYQGGTASQYIINAAFVAANLVNGTNVLCVQTHNESGSSSDMTSRVYLSFGINNTSTDYGPLTPFAITPIVFTDSNLPIVLIDTENNATIPDFPKINATMNIINNGPGVRNYVTDAPNEFSGNIGIEVRGSSSQMFPKKQWGLETRDNLGNPNDVTMFNMAYDNDWVLYAPYSDKSLMRNVLAYQMGWDLGSYAPRTELVEVVLNGQYEGVYVLTEKIKRKDGKVGTNDLEPHEINGNELTGDYVVKVDKTTSGGIVAWNSPFPPYQWSPQTIRFQLHDPPWDSLNAQQQNYIETYITDFETALNGPNFDDPVLGYAPFVDMESFVDSMLVNEVSKNVDGYRISSFLHKVRTSEGGKLFAGPLWDFNLAYGNADYCNGGSTSGWEIHFYLSCPGDGSQNPFWWEKLLQDPKYTNLLHCKWTEMRMGAWHTDSLMNRIDQWAAYLNESQERNFNRWPIHGTYIWPNNYVGNSYAEDVAYMKSWLTDRLLWLDANMPGSCPNLGIKSVEQEQITVSPNPGNQNFRFDFNEWFNNVELSVYDMTGKQVYSENNINGVAFDLKLPQVQQGAYHYKINVDQNIITGKIIVQ